MDQGKSNIDLISLEILNSLSAHIAVLDIDGTIIAINNAWKKFAVENGGDPSSVNNGSNYFNACINAVDTDSVQEALDAIDGIKKVLKGELTEFEIEYPCDSPNEKRWFLMRATSMYFIGKKAVVSHINITEKKLIENELEIRTKDLEEANTALKVLLAQRDKEKKNLETNFSDAVNGIILPYFKKIRKTHLSHLQKGYLDILETSLKEVVKPYASQLSTKMIDLTPSETRIITYIRQGDRVKEIASKLNISPRTVEFHRDNIRKKLGIKNRKINLRTYLLSIS